MARSSSKDPSRTFFPPPRQSSWCVVAARYAPGKWKTETVYAITSLTGFDADPALLARWIRGHWSIENRLHWVQRTANSVELARDRRKPLAGDGRAGRVRDTDRTRELRATSAEVANTRSTTYTVNLLS